MKWKYSNSSSIWRCFWCSRVDCDRRSPQPDRNSSRWGMWRRSLRRIRAISRTECTWRSSADADSCRHPSTQLERFRDHCSTNAKLLWPLDGVTVNESNKSNQIKLRIPAIPALQLTAHPLHNSPRWRRCLWSCTAALEAHQTSSAVARTWAPRFGFDLAELSAKRASSSPQQLASTTLFAAAWLTSMPVKRSRCHRQ